MPAKRRFPLRIHISTLFIILIVIACALITTLFYVKSREMVEKDTSRLITRIVSETELELLSISSRPESLVSILSCSTLVDAEDFESRLDKLFLLREAMLNNEGTTSIYIGYPDGEFFLFRRLRGKTDRSLFNAPPEARWLIQSVDIQPDQNVARKYFFFDNDLQMLGTAEWESEYDPRRRSWYRQALETAGTVRTSPYVFFTDRKLGLTFARSAVEKRVVVGVDIRLETLSELMGQFRITPNSQVVLFEADGRLLAHEDPAQLFFTAADAPDQLQRRQLNQLANPAMSVLQETWRQQGSGDIGEVKLQAGGEPWLATVGQLDLRNGPPIFFGMIIPYLEMTAEVRSIRDQTAVLTFCLVLALIPITMLLAKVIAKPLSKLAEEAQRISRLDFSERDRVKSAITEVDDLSRTMSFMRRTISEFLGLIESLNRESNFDTLLNSIGNEVRRAAGADGVLICLIDEEKGVLSPDAYCDAAMCSRTFELSELRLDDDLPIVEAVTGNRRTRWDLDAGAAAGFEMMLGPDSTPSTIWCVPLADRQNNSMGVIGLIYHDPEGADENAEFMVRLGFVERLSSLAGVTLETKQLIKMQKELFDAFIKLIAGAIDAKSPYTGGHCQRVPVIARMLAEAACNETDGPLAGFNLTEEQWEELHVAAWLHDCGKVTTPEFVVDKATKLETIYDRIHEVRMRFEVLKRDAEIASWKAIAGGGSQRDLLDTLQQTLTRLDDDFVFVARCNEGGEFLAEEALARLREIAAKTWVRTLDDRIGISWEEMKRKNRTPAMPVPVEEPLISDREEHLIARGEADHIEPDNPWGFKLDEPQHLYNRGEVYNLSVQRGTLSHEERYKINDHIVQTIKMLKQLPYPRHLRSVPEIAGGHHETMTGAGYPRRLTGGQMSLTAKIMVIADVYEALTAADRPYKKPKKISDAVRIMSSMQQNNHFDPDLYRLFLTSGVYREYGEKYLKKEQIDEVDVTPYL